MTPIEAARRHEGCIANIDVEDLEWLADDLGVSLESIRRLGVGWNDEQEAYTFPMRAGTGEVIGLRLRRPEGSKFAVTGSRSGLFIPIDLPPLVTVYVVEGESDCAALSTYGFDVIGRPSCRGCLHRLKSFVQRRRPSRVVFIADADQPGVDGARQAANHLKPFVRTSIYKPVDFKDVREMLRAGVRRGELNRRFERV
jgi:phage/plasmid primase-like uncharacterized protein